LLDVCDRLGVLVMDEFFDVWDTGKNPDDYSLHFAQWWREDLTSTVLRDRNHPSVVLWSLGNEIVDNTGGRRGAELAALPRELDPTRPNTLGGGSTPGPNDPSWQYVDVGDVHYNANGRTYGVIHDAHPEHAMTHNETFSRDDPPGRDVRERARLGHRDLGVGRVGLPRRGRDRQDDDPAVGTAAAISDQSVLPGWSIARTLHHNWAGFGYPFPYYQANCGAFDLIGQPKPQHFWRRAVTGASPSRCWWSGRAPSRWRCGGPTSTSW
jgi:beta-galactosidase